MKWHTFRTLPPLKVNVLIWRGLRDTDGGFPLIGKRYEDAGETFMCYKPGATAPYSGGFIDEDEFRWCRWTEIEMPEAARKKWEKEQERMAANAVYRD